jgi:hypothetical protein
VDEKRHVGVSHIVRLFREFSHRSSGIGELDSLPESSLTDVPGTRLAALHCLPSVIQWLA